jgi:predicted secreted protein
VLVDQESYRYGKSHAVCIIGHLIASRIVSSTKMSVPSISENDSGRTLNFRVGETFRIALAESPTTGYRWEIHVDQPATVEVSDSTFTPSDASVGGGGLRAFTLVTTSKGKTKLRGVLRRAWETSQPPTSSVEFTVDVSG